MLKTIFKNKLFYVALVTAFVVRSAMHYNKTYNSDLLVAYYQASDENPPTQYQKDKPLRESIVDYAKLLMGKPYKYAGKGPDVFDCSGFTGYVFKNFNINIPASSVLQSKYGEERSTEEVQKGDLLVFSSPTEGMETVGHVGIVVSSENGKINFIHSSTSRGVIIDSLDHPHYKARFIEARNVLME